MGPLYSCYDYACCSFNVHWMSGSRAKQSTRRETAHYACEKSLILEVEAISTLQSRLLLTDPMIILSNGRAQQITEVCHICQPSSELSIACRSSKACISVTGCFGIILAKLAMFTVPVRGRHLRLLSEGISALLTRSSTSMTEPSPFRLSPECQSWDVECSIVCPFIFSLTETRIKR